MFARFYTFRNVWNQAVACMAEIDVLCSMAMVSKEQGLCRPKVYEKCDKPFIDIKDMKHPCLRHQIMKKGGNSELIPNNLFMDFDSSRTILITGPNMGGKSTLLRSVCLIVIMA